MHGHKSRSEDFWPSLNTKLNLTEHVIGRFSYSKTLTRPNFADLNPGVALSTIVSNTTGLTGFGGNPYLKPVRADNFDLSAEWYFTKVGFLTATGFYRDFAGYVQPSVESANYFGDTYRVTRPRNTGDGSLKGFELGYQLFFDFLPGLLKGLGLQANYTYIDGNTTNADTGVELSIRGLSKASYNIVGLYVRGPVSARLAYNWRDEFLDVRNIAAGYDLHVAATKQLDGQISYKVSKRFTVSLEGVNLLDTHFKGFFVDPLHTELTGNFPRDTRRYDRTFTVGVRSSFQSSCASLTWSATRNCLPVLGGPNTQTRGNAHGVAPRSPLAKGDGIPGSFPLSRLRLQPASAQEEGHDP